MLFIVRQGYMLKLECDVIEISDIQVYVWVIDILKRKVVLICQRTRVDGGSM